MTVEEFYKWCKEHNVEKFQVFITDYDGGKIAGYHGVNKNDIDIGYVEKMISLG